MMLMNVTEGISPGKMMIYSGGRSTGKSMLNQYYGKLWNVNLCNEIFLPMKPEPKYKFSRAKWYEAKLPRDGQGAYNWCIKNFGAEPKNPDAWSRWYFNVERTFRFRDASDYEWFILRWS
jgi:hypothetical protein